MTQPRAADTEGRRRIGPDGEWDPRVDSGGRHADHPDFGRELPARRFAAAEVVAYVEWTDAGIAATRWEDRAEVLGTASRITTGLIRSAGLLLEQDAERVVIAGSVNPNNDDVNLVMAIPRACISRMDVWTPKRKRGR